MRVDWILLDQQGQQAVRPGDLVSVEAGGAPTWRVVRVDHGRLWLFDEVRRMDCVAPVRDFHWKAEVLEG